MNQHLRDRDDKIAHAEEVMQLLVEAVSDYSIFMLDSNGIVATWNVGAERTTGYKADEIVGKHFSVFYPGEVIARKHPEFELQEAREKGRYHEEGTRVRKDGTIYWASVTIAAIRDANGELRGYAKVTQDITERKLQEQKLRDSEERLRLLVESVVDYAIFILDPKGYIVSWNSGAQRIKGYTEAEAIGQHFSIFYPENLKKINHPQRELELATQTGRYEEEGIRLRKNGEAFHANVVITPLYDHKRCLRGFAKVTRDITERKIAENALRLSNQELELRVRERTRQLEEAKEAAESANRAKSAFLANMSHEIRTPLGVVIGFSEMLVLNNLTEEEKKECQEAISRNGNLIVSIVNDILDLSKIEAGHLKIEMQDVLLSQLLVEVSALVGMQAQEKGLQFAIDCEGQIPVTIHTDPLRLKQILVNVVGNAIKFTDKGSVRVTIKEYTSDGSVKLMFIVQDTGPGIDPEAVKNLFSPFSQADASLTRKFGGTGLGLALSRRLAQALGGDVQLTSSKVGVGSTFSVAIETGVKRTVLYDNSQPSGMGVTPVHSQSDVANLHGLKVLVVEDVYDNRILISRYLKSAGAVVECADNGLDALEKLKGADYDVVLMDLSMPIMDGYEATNKLRKNGYAKPIIALTAHALNDARNRTLNAGFNDHVTKPIDKNTLLSSLVRLVRQ